MECSCTVSGDGIDYFFELINKVTRTARKEHKCCECRETIQRGEKYLSETLKYGSLHTYKTCRTCESLRDEFFSDGFSYGNIIDDLRQHVVECSGDIPEKCLSKLPEKARGIVCQMIDDYWIDYEDEEDD